MFTPHVPWKELIDLYGSPHRVLLSLKLDLPEFYIGATQYLTPGNLRMNLLRNLLKESEAAQDFERCEAILKTVHWLSDKGYEVEDLNGLPTMRSGLLVYDPRPFAQPRAVPGVTQVVFITALKGVGYRIWPTTRIECTRTGATGRLLGVYNVGIYPNWQHFETEGMYGLEFKALPPECTTFDVIEDIPEPGGLHLKDCPRFDDDTLIVKETILP